MSKRRNAITRSVTHGSLSVSMFSDPKTLRALKSSLTPEVTGGKRTKMTLRSRKRDHELSISMTSSDLISLRASLNTNLRLASTALKSIRSTQSIFDTNPQKD